ncbi:MULTISPECIES: FMN-binding negative transcriptional regulator [Pseudomonas]|uniref:FMN-binding negative transcriptional regulator n=1 Tax=Pseudomonas capeferrum TaxID=1495066 RepID=A0ABY7R377_9PSED|nr:MULTISPECIES: FMN-binding negative transcriptional regulator [Pseudomonas]KGI92716.1 transcriptional regulator [Pseudomonas sp. H2]MUT49699.1 FMN-binding negative transcriptional regulator [Pseudomonas sp. TDA1]WCH98021.1 FMN-binding negative transcriptional regulator [Pseudomonas capeferrum]
MYVPHHFMEDRKEILHRLIIENPFGTLVSNGQSGLDANHLPFELEPNMGELGTLMAHVSKNNPLLNDITALDQVLVVFQAGNAYISPTWLPSKKDSERQVPTWNYLVAHAKGRITFHNDEVHVRKMVARLTKRHEASMDSPWKMSDAPKDYISELLTHIVSIEIEITSLLGKSKLNQDDGATDMIGAGSALIAQGEQKIGVAMLAAAKNLKD